MDPCEYERLLTDGEDRDDGPVVDDGENAQTGGTAASAAVETRQKYAYGLGHVFNDITATIWFSYTMVFMQNVVGMSPTTAGFLLFFG